MAQRKTTTKKPASTKNKNEVLITEQEVYDVLKFAQALYNGVYTPDLVNMRMKDITMSPLVATSETIATALTNPKENEEQLIGYSEWMELQSMLYKRILLYFSGLMSFDMMYVCKNATPEDYSKPAYKKDLQIVADFFDRFNIKQEFRTAMKQMLRQEVFYSVLRDEGEKYILQELPSKYAKITGRWDYGLLFDFNMYWFIQPGVSIDSYPNVFKKLFYKLFGQDGKPMNYDPSKDIDARTGTYVYWTQTKPEDGFTAMKFFPEIATMIPFLSPLMADTVLQPVIRELQKNSYIAQASKIIFGQVEFLKDAQSKVKDALSISPETLGKFLAVMKSGLPDIIKVAAAPLAGTDALEFSGSNEIYDSYNKTTSSVSGINSRLIYSYDRQNVLETKLSMDVDTNILRPVYHYFENMLEYWVNQRTKKYKFKFILEGFNTSIDREERLTIATKYAESGMVIDQKFASAMSMNPFDFRRMLAETKANKFVDNLTPILQAAQMSGDDKSNGGRPQKPDGDLTEGGSEAKEAGSNLEK